MSQDQATRNANKRREEELAAAAAAEEHGRIAALCSPFAPAPDPMAGVFFTPSEVAISDNNRFAAPQSRPYTQSPEATLKNSPAQSTSSIAQPLYSSLPSGETIITEIYSSQRSVALFAPPKKIAEQEHQEERMLRYLVAGTILTGIGGSLILGGCFTLSCPPLAASLIAVGVVLNAIGLFCYGMAAAISVSNEKPKKNGYELQGVFDAQTSTTQAEASRLSAWAFL